MPVPSYVPAPHTRVLSLFAVCQKCCRRRGLAEMRDGVVRCQLSFQPAPLSASRSAPARHHVSRRLPVRLRAHLRQAGHAPQRSRPDDHPRRGLLQGWRGKWSRLCQRRVIHGLTTVCSQEGGRAFGNDAFGMVAKNANYGLFAAAISKVSPPILRYIAPPTQRRARRFPRSHICSRDRPSVFPGTRRASVNATRGAIGPSHPRRRRIYPDITPSVDTTPPHRGTDRGRAGRDDARVTLIHARLFAPRRSSFFGPSAPGGCRN